MSFSANDHRFARICGTFLTFAAACIPNTWMPRSLITDTVLADIEEFAPYRAQAVQWLVDQHLLLTSDTNTASLVLLPRYTQVYAQQHLAEGIRLVALYNQVEAIVYAHLDALQLPTDTLELRVMIRLAQAITDRAIARQSDRAYTLCSLVGRLLLLLEEREAEEYLRTAEHLEVSGDIADNSVLHEAIAIVAAIVVSPADPGFARPYLNRMAERCARRFGVDHMVTIEVRRAIQQRFGIDRHN